MLRNLLNAVGQRVTSTHESSKPNHSNNRINQNGLFEVESLEERLMLSWVGFFDGITLDLVQTFDDGDVVVDNSGVGGAFRVIDNADTLTFVDAENISVTMLDGTANQLNFNINSTHTGNVTLNLGNGPRDIVFNGFGLPGIANVVGGNLEVNAGSGPQFINLAPITFIPIPFETGGSATFNLGTGFDTVYNNENFVIIGGDLNLSGVNLFRYTDFLFPVPLDADLKVGGNFTMDTTVEDLESFLLEGGTFHDADPDVNERSIVFGDFIFMGGDNIDHVDLNDTYIVGDVTIDLGLGTPFFGDPQNVTTTLTAPLIFGGPTAQIDGNISISGGDAALGNVITLDGEFRGDTVTFNFEGAKDTITYTLLGTQADITAVMGSNDDTFTLNVGVNVLDIDFGNDFGDAFINNYGKFTFDSDITNFHWFDHLYTVGDDALVLNQLINTGDVKIDNDGGPGAFGIDWRVTSPVGGAGSTTTASNLTLNMLDNTGNDVEMDLKNPVLAFLTLNLGDGNRDVNFTGASNNPLRDIVIRADQGIQNIEISVNAPLAVATLDIDLGAGFDMVDDDANNLLIREDLIFNGVNLFENDGLLSITRHAFISSDSATEDTIFANNATMFVGGLFTFMGGNGRDEVRLNGAVSNRFTNTVTISLGDNVTGGTQYAMLNGPNTSIGGLLSVTSTNGNGPDVFALSSPATLGGNVVVDLGNGTNDATILGVLGGTIVQYTGGSGVDTVTFGTTGNNANLNVNLGTGNDTFNLLAGAKIANNLFIDFGGGNDTFNSTYGQFDFSAMLLNLDGFDHTYVLPTNTLTSVQVAPAGPSIVVDNNGAGGAIRFIDAGTNVITAVSNLNIELLDGSGSDLTVRLENALSGKLDIDLGNGDRDLTFDGTSNSIGTTLVVDAGSGSQIVEIAVNNGLSVGGAAVFNLGTGDDEIDEDGNDVSIGGNLDFIGVNKFANDGTMTVGGSFFVNNTGETASGWLNDNASMTVDGNFTYVGGTGRDEVKLLGTTGGSTVAGNVNIDVGINTAGGAQNIWFNSMSDVGGKLDVTSTEPANMDSFKSEVGGSFGGDVTVKLGNGPNEAIVLGTFGGSNFKYTGGTNTDTVVFGLTGSPVDVDVTLGSGNDSFTLGASAIATQNLRVDFGGGNDTFTNNYGAYSFDAQLLNWQGYSRFFDLSASSLVITQVFSTADTTIDNNGVGGAIRILNGTTSQMTAADNIRVNMIANSGTNLSIDYDLPQTGDTILNLSSGDRTVRFTGNSNEIGGFLRIDAGTSGKQNIFLAENADLDVAESVVINLRGDKDIVDEGSNNLIVGTNFILRAVNTFRNDNTLDIGGNFTMNTTFDNQVSVLDNNGNFNIGGNLNYFGGTAADNVFMNSANIGGNVNVELGNGNNSQTADFSGATANRLRIAGGATTVGNFVFTDILTHITGDVIMRFDGASAVNNVTLLGTYDGNYGTYRGAGGFDNVTFGGIATNMHFVTRLAGGNDKFTLKANADLSSSLLDFGNGNDIFDDEIGEPYPFPLTILNLA